MRRAMVRPSLKEAYLSSGCFPGFFVVSALLYRSQSLLCFVVDEKLSNAFGLNCGSFSGSIATFF
jgi:hypothetical protein